MLQLQDNKHEKQNVMKGQTNISFFFPRLSSDPRTCDLITVRAVWLQRDKLSYRFSAPNCEVYILRAKDEEDEEGVGSGNLWIRNVSKETL